VSVDGENRRGDGAFSRRSSPFMLFSPVLCGTG